MGKQLLGNVEVLHRCYDVAVVKAPVERVAHLSRKYAANRLHTRTNQRTRITITILIIIKCVTPELRPRLNNLFLRYALVLLSPLINNGLAENRFDFPSTVSFKADIYAYLAIRQNGSLFH